MSSPSPSTAHVLECTSVQLAIHEQREVNLPGARAALKPTRSMGPSAPPNFVQDLRHPAFHKAD